MPDAMPDYKYEKMRLERQVRTIRVTMVDQKLQLLNLLEERERLLLDLPELKKKIPKEVTEGTDRELLTAELEREQTGLAAFNVELRLAEIDGIEARLKLNIAASAKGMADLTLQADAITAS